MLSIPSGDTGAAYVKESIVALEGQHNRSPGLSHAACRVGATLGGVTESMICTLEGCNSASAQSRMAGYLRYMRNLPTLLDVGISDLGNSPWKATALLQICSESVRQSPGVPHSVVNSSLLPAKN